MDEVTTTAPAAKEPTAAGEGYCVKCKAKRVIAGPTEVEMPGKGGAVRRAMTGTCSVCGTKMFKILGKKV